jgi:AcrR family transcriptional regulator
MSRPISISDDQILEAARVVFVRNGISATTKEIARQAGVAEGSIFRRFSTKEALFAAAVMNPRPPIWVRELDHLVGQGEPRENLIHITLGMMRFLQEMLPLVMVGWSSSSVQSAGQPLDNSREEPPGVRDRRLLTQYLQKEMDMGRLRACNAEAVARMLFGVCLNFVMDRLILRQAISQEEINTFVEGVAVAMWEGICPKTNNS